MFLTENPKVYLCKLYKAVFLLAYYGLMHIGEVTKSPHVLKAKGIHLATNKTKLLVVLYSSKTHNKASMPQEIKISAIEGKHKLNRHFCPFTAMNAFMKVHGNYTDDNEQFFIFRDRTGLS